VIEARNFRKVFGDVVAVDDVSFVAPDGRITGLLGPNGAGKTTAMRMLYTLLEPDRGQALVDGIDVADKPAEVRARLGVLPDARGLYPRLTARENIRYFGRLYGMQKAELEARIDELVDLLDMKEIANRRVDGFSQGERMKVAIGRAVIHSPKNVILDEPTTGLDVMSIRNLRGFIRALREDGACVLFSSHVMQEVAALCDTIVIIASGKVVANGSAEDLRKQTGIESLEEIFVQLTIGGLYQDAGAPEEPAS
jgi:sodium transport system ATP-binding protein